jgi:hypothetical protein
VLLFFSKLKSTKSINKINYDLKQGFSTPGQNKKAMLSRDASLQAAFGMNIIFGILTIYAFVSLVITQLGLSARDTFFYSF